MKKIIAFILVASSVVSFAGCSKKETTIAPTVSSDAVNVTIVQTKNQTIEENVTYTGEIKASEQTSVSAKIGGAAVTVHKNVGDYVTAGEVLLSIDDTDYQIKLEQALASQKQAQAGYEQALAGYEQAEAGCKQAQAGYKQANAGYEQANAMKKQASAAYDQANASYEGAVASYNSVINGAAEQTKLQLKSALDAAEIEYNNAKQNYENQKVLYEKGSISKVAYDTAVTRFENANNAYETAKENYELAINVILEENKVNAQAGVKSADAALGSAQAGLSSAEATLSSAQAGLSSAEATLSSAQAGLSSAKAGVSSAKALLENASVAVELAQNTLSDTVVYAPISGYIASKNINKGQMVSPGVELYTIKSTTTVEAQIDVTEAVISSVDIGTKAIVTVKAAGKDKIEGVVTNINPIKDTRTGMYKVCVDIRNQDNVLKDGMFADITLTLNDSKNAIVVPSEAIMEDKKGNKFVYVAEKDKAVRKNIKIGIITDETTEITSGVSKGDKIIVSGKEYLSEKNNKIRIVK